MVERLLLTPEIRGSNPNIGKVLLLNRKEKQAGNGPLKKIIIISVRTK